MTRDEARGMIYAEMKRQGIEVPSVSNHKIEKAIDKLIRANTPWKAKRKMKRDYKIGG